MPPPRTIHNPMAGPGDYTVTSSVHSDTYALISPRETDLCGRAVLITGASRGIGRAIAVSFARAGASFLSLAARGDLSLVVAAARQAALDAGRKEPTFILLEMDVRDSASVDAAVAEIERVAGRLDVVVNNAAAFSAGPLLAETMERDWWRIMEVNIKGTFLVSHAAMKLLLADTDGLRQILTVSSVAAHVLNPGASAYQTSKLAILRMTEILAMEYADRDVTAIAIHPGNVLTDMVNDSDLPADWRPLFTETPELAADTIVWLTRERRQWLSGRYVNVTWDMQQLEQKKDAIVAGDRLKVKLDVDF